MCYDDDDDDYVGRINSMLQRSYLKVLLRFSTESTDEYLIQNSLCHSRGWNQVLLVRQNWEKGES